MLLKFALLATLLASQSVSASADGQLENATNGTIVIYRPSSIMGMGVACPVRYKGKEIVELGRGKFTEWEVPSGRYILTNKTASVEVSVDPGETRYVRCQVKAGFMSGRADFQIVDQESFAQHADNYERKDTLPLSNSTGGTE